MTTYEDFIARKRIEAQPVGFDPREISNKLFPFQRDITRWALRRGRAALFAECGLGKGWMALEWAREVHEYTGRPVLIFAPLAVTQQFAREAVKLGTCSVNICKSQADVIDGINVANYDRFDKFDPSAFGGLVADESSILTQSTGKIRTALIDFASVIPYRLACTATPAPNDHEELGNHSEFLGIMQRTEMLATWFVHDGGDTQSWRLKGHAEKAFWQWVCTWAVALTSPADLGYDATGYDLPPLTIAEHTVCIDSLMRKPGQLFASEARTLGDQRAARKASLQERVARAAELVAAEPDEPWLVWCDLNDESSALTKAIPGAVEIKGSDPAEQKESRMLDFIEGRARVLVTKPSIAGFGVNLQHCARSIFVGLSHSFEQWHQANRRTWRFGQTRPVNAHVITSSAEGRVVENIKRKQADAHKMISGMVSNMKDITRADLKSAGRELATYEPTMIMRVPSWLRSEENAA